VTTATGVRPQADDAAGVAGYRGPMVSRAVRTDVAVAVALLALSWSELALRPADPGGRPATAVAYLFAAGFTLPFAVHRRHPLAAVAVTSVAVVAYSIGHYNGYPGWPVFALVVGVALHCGRREGLVAFVAGLASMTAALSLQPPSVVGTGTWISTLLVVTVAWLGGENLRAGRDRNAVLAERARRLEDEREERDRRAVAAERLRIARELHDVVAHSMSVIAVQAGVAHHVLDTRPELGRQALATVETSARAALVEMRRLLGVLRQGDEPEAILAPTPGLADVPELVRHLAEAGLEVDLTVTGAPDGAPDVVPPGVDLTAYRIVQEALTNALRHGGSPARVRIECSASEVVVDVRDPGPGLKDGAAPGTGTGHGLVGMRERVAVFGGRLRAGPDAGGFRVTATLPFGTAAGGDRP